jgi:GNAT superfamily N-acetyltransferase
VSAPRAARAALVRAAREEDAAALAALSGQLGYPATADEVRARLATIAARPGNAVLVAESLGAVAGWLHVVAVHFLECDAFAEIGGLVVGEAERGGGIGALLLRAAESWAAEHGLTSVRVRSNVVRAGAHRFYEREGYTLSKQQAVFVKRLGPGEGRKSATPPAAVAQPRTLQ